MRAMCDMSHNFAPQFGDEDDISPYPVSHHTNMSLVRFSVHHSFHIVILYSSGTRENSNSSLSGNTTIHEFATMTTRLSGPLGKQKKIWC
ncbi:hypothetical protein TNCV_2918021 [Trichonephila clavipes]|nr:hypothetical protein TNCV_2918021 [Trichonephila clavipes]